MLFEIVEMGIICMFFLYGIGYFLGLQVYDVGGLVNDDRGMFKFVFDDYLFLCCMCMVEVCQVFIIELGLYFIDSLLCDFKVMFVFKYINWDIIDVYKLFGGICIEDNIIVYCDKNENMI